MINPVFTNKNVIAITDHNVESSFEVDGKTINQKMTFIDDGPEEGQVLDISSPATTDYVSVRVMMNSYKEGYWHTDPAFQEYSYVLEVINFITIHFICFCLPSE